MAQDDRDLIYQLIADAAIDKLGGMSLISLFLSEYEARDTDTAEELLSTLGDIVADETGDRLVACAWLVGALAQSEVRSDYVEVRLRERLMAMEDKSDSLDDRGLDALAALRTADLALYSSG